MEPDRFDCKLTAQAETATSETRRSHQGKLLDVAKRKFTQQDFDAVTVRDTEVGAQDDALYRCASQIIWQA